MEKYINNDPTFYQTRQQKFCAALIKSLKQKNLQLFSDECYKFNEIIPLDKWKTTVLTRIKAHIPEAKNSEQSQPKQQPKQQQKQQTEDIVDDDSDEL